MNTQIALAKKKMFCSIRKALGVGTALFLTGILAGPVFAAKGYRCELSANSPNGWIPKALYLYLDEKNGKYAALDSYIYNAHKDPIGVGFKRRNANSVQLKWTVKNIALSNRRQKVTADYNTILNEKTGRISMTVYLHGMDMNPPTGTGKCKLEKKPTITDN